MPRAIVVGDNINALGVIRCLGRAGVPVTNVVGQPVPHTGRSRYASEIVEWPWPNGAGLLDVLDLIAKKIPGRKILFVTSDGHVKTIATNREQIDRSYLTSIPDSDTALMLINKTLFLAEARRYKCLVPDYLIAHSAAELPEVAEEVGLPVVIKPQEKCGRFECLYGAKALICRTRNDVFRIAFAEYDYKTPLLVQRFIPGGDDKIYFTLHYFKQTGEPVVAFSGRKIRQIPPLLGHTASAEPVDMPGLIAESERFFKNVGVTGLCSMEYKKAPDGRFYMIEPTAGRTNWQSALADINGVPIPLFMYAELAGAELPEANPRHNLRWVEFEGDFTSAMYYHKRNELTVCEWLKSLSSFRPAVMSFDDPVPGFLYSVGLMRRGLHRVARVFNNIF